MKKLFFVALFWSVVFLAIFNELGLNDYLPAPARDTKPQNVISKSSNDVEHQVIWVANKTLATPTKQRQHEISAFVHVGKSAGSTASLMLRNGCHSWVPKPCHLNITNETELSKQTQLYYHVPDEHLLHKTKATRLVISMR